MQSTNWTNEPGSLSTGARRGRIPASDFPRTGCKFSGAQTLLAWARVEDNRGIPARCDQKNTWWFVEVRVPGMRLSTLFFGRHAPDAQNSQWSRFPHSFKQLEIFLKLASKVSANPVPPS
jgi:hypothetical protein